MDYYSAKLSSPNTTVLCDEEELLTVVKNLEHFHSYLYGAEFTIMIDHAALR